MKTKYKPQTPTKVQLCCNAIRDMFFNRFYNGVIPAKDIETVKNGKTWHSAFTKKAVQQALKKLDEEGYMNLDEKKENWLWGGDMHEMLFGRNS